MNSNLLRAPGKDTEKTLLTRSWMCSLMLALVTLLSVTSAFAAPGVQVGNQNMFRPAGMVKAIVPNPAGGPPLTDWWVSDGASGFCRLDNTGPDTAPSNGILNLSTCYLPGVLRLWIIRLKPGVSSTTRAFLPTVTSSLAELKKLPALSSRRPRQSRAEPASMPPRK